jgi:hypothetical protein
VTNLKDKLASLKHIVVMVRLAPCVLFLLLRIRPRRPGRTKTAQSQTACTNRVSATPSWISITGGPPAALRRRNFTTWQLSTGTGTRTFWRDVILASMGTPRSRLVLPTGARLPESSMSNYRILGLYSARTCLHSRSHAYAMADSSVSCDSPYDYLPDNTPSSFISAFSPRAHVKHRNI